MLRLTTAILPVVCLILASPVFGGIPSRFHELAQIADGGTASLWMQTTILIVNQGQHPREANITLRFYKDDGGLLTMTVNGMTGTVYNAAVPAGGMLKLKTPGKGSDLQVGWATLTADRDVGAQVFFEFYNDDVLTTQAAVESFGPMHAVNLFADFNVNEGRRSGFAIVNLCDQASITALFVASDENGDPWHSGTLKLDPLGHAARYLDENGLLGTASFKGTVKVTATGPFSLVALQQKEQKPGFYIVGTLSPISRTLNARWGGGEE